MNLKHTFSVATVAITFLVGLPLTVSALESPASAAAKTTTGALTTKAAERADLKAAKLSTKESLLKTRANKEIDRRIEALGKLTTLLGKMKHLTGATQATLTTQIASQVTALNDLRTKINAESDPTALKVLVKSIVDSYRIFALFMPQINILAAADRTIAVADELNILAEKLTLRLVQLEAEGQSVAEQQTALADLKNMTAAAKSQADSAIRTILDLKPEGFPDNKGSLTSARDMIKTARADLQTARADAAAIIKRLKENQSTRSIKNPSTELTASPAL